MSDDTLPSGYEKINSHPNGPSYLDATEFGDGWHEAMQKIDRMFRALFSMLQGGMSATDTEARAEIEALKQEVAELRAQLMPSEPPVPLMPETPAVAEGGAPSA